MDQHFKIGVAMEKKNNMHMMQRCVSLVTICEIVES